MDRSADWINLFGKTSDGDQRQVEGRIDGKLTRSMDKWHDMNMILESRCV